MEKSSRFHLKDKQKAALTKMLAFNVEALDGIEQEASGKWKVLVYDQFCRSIVSPILKLHELRLQRVTLHYLLESARDPVPDVSAVYFVRPTEENIRRIAKDCEEELYSSIHLNFACSQTPRKEIELLAKLVGESKCGHMISKLYDQHVNFVTLEPNLFTLNQPGSYLAYNDPTLQDSQIEGFINSVSDGLFSILATLKEVPVIRCPSSDGPSRMVAEKLCNTLREDLVGRNSLFNGAGNSAGFQRPVLIVMDRNEDLASQLHHPSTYQALVDDLLGINMNRVIIEVKSGVETSKKVLDLDVSTDSFFANHAGDRFPEAIAANEAEMQKVTEKEEEIRAKAGGSGSSNGTKDLASAVGDLPAVLEKKTQLGLHTSIFQVAFEQVAARNVPAFSVVEQKLIDGLTVEKGEVMELLVDQEKGNVNDKLRLLMIYYLSTNVSSEESKEMEKSLQDYLQQKGDMPEDQIHTALASWRYIRRQTNFQRHASVGESLMGTTASAAPSSLNPNMALFKDLAGNLAGQAQGWLSQAAQSVKNFLPENKKLHITRVTDAICELKQNTEDDTFLYLDPKVKSSTREAPRQKTAFTKAIIFMIGGGNYNEFQNVSAYAKAQPGRQVLYGCTELLNSDEFMQQLAGLDK